ncbi:hypothetical protein K7H91_15745 [Martelella mediterranea]|nr:hypothetical protein [Martelella mediterranea]
MSDIFHVAGQHQGLEGITLCRLDICHTEKSRDGSARSKFPNGISTRSGVSRIFSIFADNAGKRFTGDRLGKGEDRGLDPEHPLAPTQIGRELIGEP